MSVYVDESVYGLGRMKMCHMIADTSEELLKMVDCIGVDRKYIQYPNTECEHFDICKSKRRLAVSYGALEVTSREIVELVKHKRKTAGSGGGSVLPAVP